MTILEFFTANRHISFCENQMRIQREDFLERLREKDAEIRRLRVSLAARSDRIAASEDANAVALPKTQPVPVIPYDGPLDWQGELSKMLDNDEESDDASERVD